VYESDAEVLELQAILDRSMDDAGAHMRSIFGPRDRLSARQVCDRLQGVKQVAAATTTARGEPRVAPIDAAFFKGRFYLSTDAGSVRARHLVRRPAVSVTYFEGADTVIIVHGKASFVARDDPAFEALDAEWVKTYGKSITEISDGVRFIRVEPTKMFAYSLRPVKF
jgi:Pyridoxamine 5'-phosphate oxidase